MVNQNVFHLNEKDLSSRYLRTHWGRTITEIEEVEEERRKLEDEFEDELEDELECDSIQSARKFSPANLK